MSDGPTARASVLCLLVLAVMASCTSANNVSDHAATSSATIPTTTPFSAAPPTTTPVTAAPTTTVASPAATVPVAATPHRIAIRSVGDVAEFYDTVTGEEFVPRGNNYNILREVDDALMGRMALDTTLSTGLYDTDRTERDLARMEEMGYNIVRIMPETCGATGCITGLEGRVRGEYVDNLVDFIGRAKSHGIYTWIASNTLPDVGRYIAVAHGADNQEFSSANSEFLTAAGLAAYESYFTDLITALIDRDAPFDSIFSYSLRQEHSFDSAAPPLSLTTGTVATANGLTYDMGDLDDRMRMVDDGLRHWITRTRDAIRELDPTALVSVGFFAPNEPNAFRAGDTRLVRAAAALDSDLDFVDFHVYPSPPDALLAQHVENFQMEGRDDIPIVMGEMAAFSWYDSEAAGAQALHDLQVESCHAGFDGWLTWSWDIPAQPDIWHAATGQGLVGEVLSPAKRPDPCSPGRFDFFEYSLTERATATASRSLPDQPAEAAIDGGSPQWGSGADAPQYIEIALESPQTVDEIRLTVAQFPAGPTRHEVWVGQRGDPPVLVYTFDGSTAEQDVLVYSPPVPLEDVDVVRIVTTVSPSWVAWREIRIISRRPPDG
jgi:hypothetical protein